LFVLLAQLRRLRLRLADQKARTVPNKS